MQAPSIWDSQLAAALLGAALGAVASGALTDLWGVYRRRRTFLRLLHGIIGADLVRLAPYLKGAPTPAIPFKADPLFGVPALLGLPPGGLSESYGTLPVALLLELGELDHALWTAATADELAAKLTAMEQSLREYEKTLFNNSPA